MAEECALPECPLVIIATIYNNIPARAVGYDGLWRWQGQQVIGLTSRFLTQRLKQLLVSTCHFAAVAFNSVNKNILLVLIWITFFFMVILVIVLTFWNALQCYYYIKLKNKLISLQKLNNSLFSLVLFIHIVNVRN